MYNITYKKIYEYLSTVLFGIFALSMGLKCITGKLEINFNGTDSHKHDFLKSQSAPSK